MVDVAIATAQLSLLDSIMDIWTVLDIQLSGAVVVVDPWIITKAEKFSEASSCWIHGSLNSWIPGLLVTEAENSLETCCDGFLDSWIVIEAETSLERVVMDSSIIGIVDDLPADTSLKSIV
jgi:hypothetical protein